MFVGRGPGAVARDYGVGGGQTRGARRVADAAFAEHRTRREIGGGRAGASRVVHASGHAVPDAPGHIEVSVGAILSRVRARRERRVEPWFRVPSG